MLCKSLQMHQEGRVLIMGNTLQVQGEPGPFQKQVTHIKYLEPRLSFGPKGVPRPLLEPYCYHSYGQHHGGCLFKEGGSKSGPLCALLWRILTWCSRKKAPARHIPASTMSRPGIHCVKAQYLVYQWYIYT